jgi:hypothetical protein
LCWVFSFLSFLFFSFFFFFVVLGFGLRAYTLSHPPALFCDGFFQDQFSLNNHKSFCVLTLTWELCPGLPCVPKTSWEADSSLATLPCYSHFVKGE